MWIGRRPGVRGPFDGRDRAAGGTSRQAAFIDAALPHKLGPEEYEARGLRGPGNRVRGSPARGDRLRVGRAYGKPLGQAVPIPITGHPAEAAERLAAYRDAGADYLVIGISGGDWRHQCDLLAKARAMPA